MLKVGLDMLILFLMAGKAIGVEWLKQGAVVEDGDGGAAVIGGPCLDAFAHIASKGGEFVFHLLLGLVHDSHSVLGFRARNIDDKQTTG